MDKKEKLFIAKMIEKQALFSRILYEKMGIIGEDILSEFDEAMAFDDILDYIGMPRDNTLQFSDGHPDVFCRDCCYDILYELKSFADVLIWLTNELEFIAQLKECGGIAKWREKYDEKE